VVFVILEQTSENMSEVAYVTRFLDDVLERLAFLRLFNPFNRYEWDCV